MDNRRYRFRGTIEMILHDAMLSEISSYNTETSRTYIRFVGRGDVAVVVMNDFALEKMKEMIDRHFKGRPEAETSVFEIGEAIK